MTAEKINEGWAKFSTDYADLVGMVVVDKDAKILHSNGEVFVTEAEAATALESWLAEVAKPFEISKGRFVPLKNDPLQFVCTNKSDNLSLVGSVTQKGNYGLLLIGAGNKVGMLPMSVEFSRFIWELI
jgi:hypothetical protein